MEYFRKKKDAEKKGTVASNAVTPQMVQCSPPFQESSQSQSPNSYKNTKKKIPHIFIIM